MADAVALLLLAHACVTDLRERRICNGALMTAGVAGVVLAVAAHGMPGLVRALDGGAAGLVWWPGVRWLGLGGGDLKLAVVLGVLLGPAGALLAPALGFVVCAAWLAPQALWRRWQRRAWHGWEVPLAPWIALGAVVEMVARR